MLLQNLPPKNTSSVLYKYTLDSLVARSLLTTVLYLESNFATNARTLIRLYLDYSVQYSTYEYSGCS
jgi:hypothetical protein